MARIALRVGAEVCKGVNSTAVRGGWVGVSNITFRVPSSGNYNLSMQWSLNAGVLVKVVFNGTSTANVRGFVSLAANWCLRDLNVNNSTRLVSSDCSGGRHFGSVNSAVNLSTNITAAFREIGGGNLIANHTYELGALIHYWLAAGIGYPAGPGCRVTVELNLEPPLYGAALLAVVVNT